MLKPIQKEEGTTAGERELAKLADLSFFGLWSYPSVHREIIKKSHTIRHEVADLIVVFGRDVIFFSEKDITFPDTDDLALAWSRWFRQSVSKSVGQLRGAEQYIKSGRSALFLDPKCTQPFPFTLAAADFNVHLVAICRNSSDRAKRYFSQFEEAGALSSSGTLAFAAPMREEQMLANPFWIGDFDPQKTFIHVFDEDSIHLLLTELDAGPDFIDYLRVRERAVREEYLSVFYGEEDFLAVYLTNIRENGFGDYRPDQPTSTSTEENLFSLEEGMWLAFKQTVFYTMHQAQRKNSGAWKMLTNDLSQAILTATVGEAQEESLAIHEQAARAMASENRVSRALLGRALMEKFDTVPTRARSARIVQSLSSPERLYIFLLFPWIDAHGTYEGYRAERMACMQLYARAAQLKFPSYSEIVVLGADTKGSAGSSETVLVVEGDPGMSDEQKVETQTMMDEHRILTDISQSPFHSYRQGMSTANVFGTLHRRKEQLSGKPPGVNEPCYCGSGKKYKKCCRP